MTELNTKFEQVSTLLELLRDEYQIKVMASHSRGHRKRTLNKLRLVIREWRKNYVDNPDYMPWL